MSYTRLALAAVVATVVDMIYGFAVYGTALANEFGRYPGVFRHMDEINTKMPFLIVGTLVAMFAVAYIYAKGYEGGSGIQEGLRFGALIGVFAVGYIAVGNYVVMNIGRRLAVSMAVAGFVEWVVVGMALGVMYKPAGKTSSGR
jgi:membrane protease YdiL (CAAX protease family)